MRLPLCASLILVAAAVFSLPPRADEGKKAASNPASGTPSAPTSKDTDMESALAEFKAAAERLGKSMTRAAEDGTSEARNKVMKTMNNAILELSHSMDRAATKIGARKSASGESAKGDTPKKD